MNQEERIRIETMLEAGYTQSAIAKLLNRSESTISRELGRNMPKRGRGAGQYIASRAQTKTDHRHRHKRKAIKLTSEMKSQISELIKEQRLSPELISGRAKLEKVNMVTMRLYINLFGTASMVINDPTGPIIPCTNT